MRSLYPEVEELPLLFDSDQDEEAVRWGQSSDQLPMLAAVTLAQTQATEEPVSAAASQLLASKATQGTACTEAQQVKVSRPEAVSDAPQAEVSGSTDAAVAMPPQPASSKPIATYCLRPRHPAVGSARVLDSSAMNEAGMSSVPQSYYCNYHALDCPSHATVLHSMLLIVCCSLSARNTHCMHDWPVKLAFFYGACRGYVTWSVSAGPSGCRRDKCCTSDFTGCRL